MNSQLLLLTMFCIAIYCTVIFAYLNLQEYICYDLKRVQLILNYERNWGEENMIICSLSGDKSITWDWPWKLFRYYSFLADSALPLGWVRKPPQAVDFGYPEGQKIVIYFLYYFWGQVEALMGFFVVVVVFCLRWENYLTSLWCCASQLVCDHLQYFRQQTVLG